MTKIKRKQPGKPRKRGQMTIRQRKLIKGVVLEGKTVVQAGKDAGYKSKATSHEALTKLDPEIRAACIKHGLNMDFLVGRMKGMCDAKEIKVMQHEGEFIYSEEVIDNGIRLQALDRTARILGAYADRGRERDGADAPIVQQIGGLTINLTLTPAEAKAAGYRLSSVDGTEVRGDTGQPGVGEEVHGDTGRAGPPQPLQTIPEP